MSNDSVYTNRKDVINIIASASIYGNLILFIGSGFTKAVFEEEIDNPALTWGELIKNIAIKLDIDYDTIIKKGDSYPEVALKICKEYSKNQGKPLEEAKFIFKQQVCKSTCWIPPENQIKKYKELLLKLNPAWIFTTNYDQVIETILTGRCISLSPTDLFSKPKGLIPIYHLHGIRTNPESIIITQDDYISLFRPNEYRQLRLTITLKESVTLMIGYRLGDFNVLTAVDWSKNVFNNEPVNFPQGIIQIIRKDNPKRELYLDINQVNIIETNVLPDILNEIIENIADANDKNDEKQTKISAIAVALNNPTEETINMFIDDNKFRLQLIGLLKDSNLYLIHGFMNYLNACIEKTWERAEPKNAFEAYDQSLTILLDLLVNIDIKKMPPALLSFIAKSFHRLGYYIGNGMGQSHAAYRTWCSRKSELSSETKSEMILIAKNSGYFYVINLFES